MKIEKPWKNTGKNRSPCSLARKVALLIGDNGDTGEASHRNHVLDIQSWTFRCCRFFSKKRHFRYLITFITFLSEFFRTFFWCRVPVARKPRVQGLEEWQITCEETAVVLAAWWMHRRRRNHVKSLTKMSWESWPWICWVIHWWCMTMCLVKKECF